MNTNLLWGLTSPWQRTLCRSQARLLIQDKLESEFYARKLPAVRRLDEAAAWRSSDSDDPLKPALIKNVKSHPVPQDIKFIKRYIAFCTPKVLQFRESKRRKVQEVFAPRNLEEKERFTENKAEKILEERRLRAARKEQRRAARLNGAIMMESEHGGVYNHRRKDHQSPRTRHSLMDMSEQYSSQRDRMPKIDLGFGGSKRQNVNRSTNLRADLLEDSSDEEQQMQERIDMIKNAYASRKAVGAYYDNTVD